VQCIYSVFLAVPCGYVDRWAIFRQSISDIESNVKEVEKTHYPMGKCAFAHACAHVRLRRCWCWQSNPNRSPMCCMVYPNPNSVPDYHCSYMHALVRVFVVSVVVCGVVVTTVAVDTNSGVADVASTAVDVYVVIDVVAVSS